MSWILRKGAIYNILVIPNVAQCPGFLTWIVLLLHSDAEAIMNPPKPTIQRLSKIYKFSSTRFLNACMMHECVCFSLRISICREVDVEEYGVLVDMLLRCADCLFYTAQDHSLRLLFSIPTNFCFDTLIFRFIYPIAHYLHNICCKSFRFQAINIRFFICKSNHTFIS